MNIFGAMFGKPLWLLAFTCIALSLATPSLHGEDLSQLIDNLAGEKTPGLAVSVLQDDRVVFQRARGLLRMDQNSPNSQGPYPYALT